MSSAVELTVYNIIVQANIKSLIVQKNYLVVSADLNTAKREALDLAGKEFTNPSTDIWVCGEARDQTANANT